MAKVAADFIEESPICRNTFNSIIYQETDQLSCVNNEGWADLITRSATATLTDSFCADRSDAGDVLQ